MCSSIEVSSQNGRGSEPPGTPSRQNHRMAVVRRTSGSQLLQHPAQARTPRAGFLKKHLDHVQVALEYLQGWRLHHLSKQPVSLCLWRRLRQTKHNEWKIYLDLLQIIKNQQLCTAICGKSGRDYPREDTTAM